MEIAGSSRAMGAAKTPVATVNPATDNPACFRKRRRLTPPSLSGGIILGITNHQTGGGDPFFGKRYAEDTTRLQSCLKRLVDL